MALIYQTILETALFFWICLSNHIKYLIGYLALLCFQLRGRVHTLKAALQGLYAPKLHPLLRSLYYINFVNLMIKFHTGKS